MLLGFPVTLSRSGSYVLSSNLIAPADKTGIVIAANDVTIDLNGFKIAGSGPAGVSSRIWYWAGCISPR